MALTTRIPGSVADDADALLPQPPLPVAPTTIATDVGLEELTLADSDHTLDFSTFMQVSVLAAISGTSRLVLPADAGVAATCLLRATLSGPATFTVHHGTVAGATLLTVSQPSATDAVAATFVRAASSWVLLEAGYDS